MPRKIIIVDWDGVTEALCSGQLTKIEQFASLYKISRPTAKKMLSEKYGPGIRFHRGRGGGMSYYEDQRPMRSDGDSHNTESRQQALANIAALDEELGL
jgi:hypothetical protein